MDEYIDKQYTSEDFYSDFTKIDISILLITLKRRLWVVIVFAIIGFMLFGLGAKYLIPKKWTANAQVIWYNKNLTNNTEIPYLYQNLRENTIIEILRLRQTLKDVLDNLKKEGDEEVSGMTPVDLAKMVDVEMGNSDIFNIYVTSANPDLSVKLCNEVAKVFIDQTIAIQNSSAQKMTAYYEKREEQLRKKVAELSLKAENFLNNKGVISIEVERGLKLQQRNTFELKKLETEMQVSDLETKIETLKKKIKELPGEVMTAYEVRPVESRVLDAMEEELSLLRQRYTDKNPKIIQLKMDIENMRKKMAIENKNAAQGPARVMYGRNQLKYSLEMEKLRSEAQLKSLSSNIPVYDHMIKQIQNKLQEYSKLENEFNNLKTNLEHNRQMLAKVQGSLAIVRTADESTTSDLKIVQKAIKPKYPAKRYTKVLAVFGGILFLGMALALVLGRELFNFSVKSKYDFDNILRVNMIGAVPDEDQISKSEFYSAFQILVDKALKMAKTKKNNLFVYGSDRPDTGKSFIIDHTIDILSNKKTRILYIETVHEISNDIKPYLINPFLFPQNDEEIEIQETGTPAVVQVNQHLDKAYLHLNDSTYKTMLEDNTVTAFKEKLKDYDHIMWKMFDIEENTQLFTTVASVADLTILVARFKSSEKFDYRNTIQFLKNHGVDNIAGVLNYIPKVYYSKTV